MTWVPAAAMSRPPRRTPCRRTTSRCPTSKAALDSQDLQSRSRRLDLLECSIRRALPPFVTVVGLFVNADRETVVETARAVHLDLLQFHGDESRAQCELSAMPYMKAIRVSDDVDLGEMSRRYAGAKALLLDTHDDKLWGGSGRTFDWDAVPADLALPVVLAGGLSPANVADAIRRLRPYGVDVSGGVEQAPGIKDAARIAKFIEEVDRVSIAERTR